MPLISLHIGAPVYWYETLRHAEVDKAMLAIDEGLHLQKGLHRVWLTTPLLSKTKNFVERNAMIRRWVRDTPFTDMFPANVTVVPPNRTAALSIRAKESRQLWLLDFAAFGDANLHPTCRPRGMVGATNTSTVPHSNVTPFGASQDSLPRCYRKAAEGISMADDIHYACLLMGGYPGSIVDVRHNGAQLDCSDPMNTGLWQWLLTLLTRI